MGVEMTDSERVLRERRNFLRGTLGVVPAIALTGGGVCLAPPAQAAPVPTPAYKPTYFNEAEWAFLNAATERLIPTSEDGPGARDAGVPEFIDRQMQTDYGYGGRWYLQGPFDPQAPDTLGYQLRYSPREFYRAAVPEIDSWCRRTRGKLFADLEPGIQDQVLGILEGGGVDLPSVKASEFFSQLLNNTKEGYFADPMYGGNRAMGGWKMIGFPGARGDYADWVKRPGEAYPLGPVSILGEKG
jgi:gluconate 2-dehydrogenase gamma chain